MHSDTYPIINNVIQDRNVTHSAHPPGLGDSYAWPYFVAQNMKFLKSLSECMPGSRGFSELGKLARGPSSLKFGSSGHHLPCP